MLKNWKKKTIAILLIFTMTFSDFALVGKAYATTMMDGIFGISAEDAGDTGSKNVEFDAYFKTSPNSKETKTVSSDIKETELIVGATVKVKDSGYLKDAKILFGNGEELNFNINTEVIVPAEQTEEQEKVSAETTEFFEENVVSPYENIFEQKNISDELGTMIQETLTNTENVLEDESMAINSENSLENEETSVNVQENNGIISDQNNEGVIINQEIESLVNAQENDETVSGTEQVLSNDENNSDEENSEETQYETISLVDDNEKIQRFENNELYLVQLNATSEMNIEFPISYQYRKFVEETMISKTNKIKFEGTYVNDKAEEIAVSKTVDLKLSWEDEREVKTSSEIIKYLGFNQNGVDGIILQASVVVDSETENASLPIKDSKVEVIAPEIDGVKPDTVNVVAKSLSGTTGKENDEVVFGENNWNYDSDKNKITIKVENSSEKIREQNETDTLVDETAPIKDMYYSESGVDEYLITYTYKNVSVAEREISTTINAVLNEFGTKKLTSENTVVSQVKDEIGSIVTYSNETVTDSVSKGYTYLNYNNEENKYEIEVDNKLIFNVSFKDIVEGLYYTDNGSQYVSKTGEEFVQNDLYYKTLTLNKDNFVKMLGEDGKVNIYNNGEVIFTITNETNANEAGVIEIKFDNSVKSVQIETSKPISDGNLIFGVVRAYSDVSYSKDEYKNFDKLIINTVGNAKYIYLNELVNIGNSSLDVKLNDTKTEAKLEIGQESLSTLAMNNNVELKIELNNDKIESDVYGNSRFQIKLPEYVENVEVTDFNIVYGEGLELDQVQGFVQDGSAYIDVTVTGKQNALSSGIVSNGTNIVLNTNIKVDLFAPATSADFELTYVNDEATNYSKEGQTVGFTTASVIYSAPSGVVSVNSLSGYGSKTITSVNQGKVQDEIEVYSDSKTVNTELVIMNNEKNDVSDLVILGRVPFEGVKDIVNGEDLGTTLTTKMVSSITPDNMNEVDFKYYYSENGEATKDLTDSSNGWTDELNSLDNVKSFLIVPVNSEYKMEPATKLKFIYKYEIPANLEHNEEIYGTFATYYTNNTEVATISDVSKADIVGLITGEGPQFDFTTTTNKTNINEFEELEITATAKNTGKMTAENIVVTIPVPEYTKYVSASCDKEEASWSEEDEKIEFKLASLDVDDTVTFKIRVKVDQIYDRTDEDVEMKVYSSITATDLDAILKTEEQIVTVKKAEMKVSLERSATGGDMLYKGCDAEFYVKIQNLKNDTIQNAVATMQIPNGLKFVDGSVLGISEDGFSMVDIRKAEYNEATRVVTWKIDDISTIYVKKLRINFEIDDMDKNLTEANLTMSVKVKADETEEYSSENIDLKIGRPLLTISQTTTTTNSYVKEGETINYQFNIKNEGTVTAQNVELIDYIPNGLVVKSLSYVSQGIEVKRSISDNDEIIVEASIPAGDILKVNILASPESLNGAGEKSVTNKATVTGQNIEEIESNDITHIIEASNRSISSSKGEQSTGLASSVVEGTPSISKTYKITGIAWHDKNNDGMRDESEELMKGIVATLVDSDNGVIKQSTTTNSKGEYTFTGVKNGNYIVIFDYDTVRYTVTVYQKENVAQNVNSDVITAKIEQDGILRNGAVTRVFTVEDGSVSNIDIGLIDALKFDLSLDMGISKITTNTSKGTETKTYENSKLTKTEIGAKQVAGSSVYIEYTFKVKNEGELAGFAKKIVDYLPEGMEFNSGMNQNWFTGSDGNLYTTELSDVEIQPGETKTFKLVLSKQLTNDNIGTVSNTAEIVEDYNIYGISDLDSIPSNKAQNEDDFARADSYLSVKTGEVFIYISVIITTIILVGIAVAVVVLKFKSKLTAKGGV